MKISQQTISILENFNSINKNLLVRAGSTIRTVSENRTIAVQATVDEQFPQDFGIYDLSKFLGISSLFTDPDYNFGGKSLDIQSGNRSVHYVFANESTLTDPDQYINKLLTIEINDVVFSVSNDDLAAVRKGASVLAVPEIAFVGNGSSVDVVALNKKDSSCGNFDIGLDANTDKKFEVIFKVENLKLLPGSYDVKLTERVGYFSHKDLNLQYWVAVEETSSFGA